MVSVLLSCLPACYALGGSWAVLIAEAKTEPGTSERTPISILNPKSQKVQLETECAGTRASGLGDSQRAQADSKKPSGLAFHPIQLRGTLQVFGTTSLPESVHRSGSLTASALLLQIPSVTASQRRRHSKTGSICRLWRKVSQDGVQDSRGPPSSSQTYLLDMPTPAASLIKLGPPAYLHCLPLSLPFSLSPLRPPFLGPTHL